MKLLKPWDEPVTLCREFPRLGAPHVSSLAKLDSFWLEWFG